MGKQFFLVFVFFLLIALFVHAAPEVTKKPDISRDIITDYAKFSTGTEEVVSDYIAGALYKYSKADDVIIYTKKRSDSYCTYNLETGLRHCEIPVEILTKNKDKHNLDSFKVNFSGLEKYNPTLFYSTDYDLVYDVMDISDWSCIDELGHLMSDSNPDGIYEIHEESHILTGDYKDVKGCTRLTEQYIKVSKKKFYNYKYFVGLDKIDLTKPTSVLAVFDMPISEAVHYDVEMEGKIDLSILTTKIVLDPQIGIANCDDLSAIRFDLTADYVLSNNIDCNISPYNVGVGFVPIGNQSTQFRGTFNGNGHKIYNLYVAPDSPADTVGLFSYSSTGKLENVGLINTKITGRNEVGSLVGFNRGIISNSYSTGSINGDGNTIGGLVGLNYYGIISNSYFIGGVSAKGIWTGGLSGYNLGGTINNSYSAGNVNSTGSIGGGSYVGGLVGGNGDNGTINSSYSTGTVNGIGNIVGGLVGYNYSLGSISNSYSAGTVSGNSYVGGLIGVHSNILINSYSVGRVSGTGSYVGGLVGRAYSGSSCSNSFWDKITSEKSTSACGTGKTTTQMKQKSTFTNWDFVNTWGITENQTYPFLKGVLLKIIFPINGASFYPNQTMNIQFMARDQDGNPMSGLTQIEYKLKDSDDWTTKNIDVISVGTYSFSVQASSTTGNYELSIKTELGGSSIIDTIAYTVNIGDLYIESIKPIQVVEDVNLVTDKATVVRVTVKNTGNPATLRTKLTYNGQDYYQTETINDSNTIDFYPNPYSTPGKYQITAIVNDNNQVPETNENNNTKIIDVNVMDTKGLKILFLRFDYNSTDAYLADTNLFSTYILDTYPIIESESLLVPNSFPLNSAFIGGSTPFLGPSLVLQTIDLAINLSKETSFDRIVGLVPPGWFEQRGVSAVGLSNLGGKTALIEGGNEWYQDTISHELGHTYNLCDEYKRSFWTDQNNRLAKMGGCPNNFPLNCSGQEYCQGNDDINGFSVRNKDPRKTGEQSNYESDYLPPGQTDTWFSFMGSAGPFTWTSKEAYTQLLKKLDPNRASDPQVLFIQGLIDANGDITFYPFYLIDGYPSGLTDGNYAIELQDINNNIIRDINFGPPLLADLNWGRDVNVTAFDFTIDYNSNIYKIVGKYAGNIKAERLISSVAPTVTVVYPKQGDVWTDTNSIQWTATDTDSNNLSYSLLSTNDNGASWRPIALDVTDTNYTWDISQVDPKSNYKIKVIATDGVLTGDNNSGTFTIQAPNIVLAPYLWNLGKQAKGRILESNFTMTNSGNAGLDLFSIASSPGISISGISLPISLQPEESQTFTATIDTLQLSGEYSGDINISSNDPNESIKTIFVDTNIQQVSPQPNINISTPFEVNYPNSFSLGAIVTTQNAPLRDSNVTISLPPGLSTTDPLIIELENVFESGSSNASWNITPSQLGLFEIVLTVSSVNAADFNESVLVAVTSIGISGLATDKDSYYSTETIKIDSNITNFNSEVTYTNLDLNAIVTDPQDNNTNLHTDINVLFAGTTQTISTYWAEQNKNPGNYKLTVYVYDSNGQLLDSTLTTFEVLPTKINWITGYGGKKIIGVDYNITYSILPQPTKKIVSVDYNVLMGWSNQ